MAQAMCRKQYFQKKGNNSSVVCHKSGVNIVLHHKSCLQVSWEEVRGSFSHGAEVNKLIMPFCLQRQKVQLFVSSIYVHLSLSTPRNLDVFRCSTAQSKKCS